MRWIEVDSSLPLQGDVSVPGSKNSTQALILASCLADAPVCLQGVPGLRDIGVIQALCASVGVKLEIDSHKRTLFVDGSNVSFSSLDLELSAKYRASYYFVGALLAKLGKVSIGYPGGDDFGSRPIEQHFKGLRALGAEVEEFPTHYVVTAKQLRGAEIYFDVVTMGGTINVMLAAVKAQGVTVLRNAARDPEVVDVANLLNRMGAKVRGAGSDIIRIEGVRELSGCSHTVIPDRLIAGTYLIAAAATGGNVTVHNVIPEHLTSCVSKLTEMGVEVSVHEQSVCAWAKAPLKPVRIRTNPYPGFATDLQQPMTAALLRASGRSLIVDTIYPHRTSHIPQLARMGAVVAVRRKGVVVTGPSPLHGAWVHATDVRAGACLLIAALAAEGKTCITGVEHIERGYENVEAVLGALGAKVRFQDADALPDEALRAATMVMQS